MKVFNKSILAIAIVFAFGCGNQNTAENSVKQFFTLIKNKDFVKAKEFGTKKTEGAVDAIKKNVEGSSFDPKSVVEAKEVSCKEDGDAKKKKCEVCCDGNGNKKTVKVIEENGKWLIDMDKTELKNGMPKIEDTVKDINKGIEEGANKLGDEVDKVNEKMSGDKNATYKKGEKVEVLWGKKWYKSTVLEVKDKKYKIHYEGWGDNFDEWVTAEKMKK